MIILFLTILNKWRIAYSEKKTNKQTECSKFGDSLNDAQK